MIRFAHWLLVVLYVSLPAFVLLVGLAQMRRTKRTNLLWSLLLSAAAGTGFGVSLGYIYTKAVGGRVLPTQMILAAYFATAMLLLLKAIDGVMLEGLRRLFGVSPTSAADAPPSRASLWFRQRMALLVRTLLAIAIGLPYIMAAILTYRPKIGEVENPQKQLGYKFTPVAFESTDGVKLSGWWLPAHDLDAHHADPAAHGGVHAWGKDTVIVCHGLGANKSNQLILARALPPNGYNALVFDFRAHGESGGQLTTFGDLEQRDVLGAVRWIRQNHADESRRILGVGASMGAAALIAAAGDDSAEGRAIDAIAVYAPYDSIPSLARAVSDAYFPQPFNWLTVHIGLPMASLQTGVNLADFAPIRSVDKLWPRPLLVIHGVKDEIIPFELGQRLFDTALQPKQRYWIADGNHNDVINDEAAAREVKEFFDNATALPVI